MDAADDAEEWVRALQARYKTRLQAQLRARELEFASEMTRIAAKESKAVGDGALDSNAERELARARRNAATAYEKDIRSIDTRQEGFLQDALAIERATRNSPGHEPDASVSLTRPLDRSAPTWLRALHAEYTQRLKERRALFLHALESDLLQITLQEIAAVAGTHGARAGLHEDFDAARERMKADYDAQMKRAPYVEDELFRRAVAATKRNDSSMGSPQDDEPVRVQKKQSSPTLQRPPSRAPAIPIPRPPSVRQGSTSSISPPSWRSATPSVARPGSAVPRIWHPPASEYEREHRERAKERDLSRPPPIRTSHQQQRSGGSSASPGASAEGFAAAGRSLSRRPTLSSFNSSSRMSGTLSSSVDATNDITVLRPLADNAEEWLRALHANHVAVYEAQKEDATADLNDKLDKIARDEAEASSHDGPSTRIDAFKDSRERAQADWAQQLQSIAAIQDIELRDALSQRRRPDEREAAWDAELARPEQDVPQSEFETGPTSARRESFGFWRPPGTDAQPQVQRSTPISIPSRPTTATAHHANARPDTSIWRPRASDARPAASIPRSQTSAPRPISTAARESLPLFPDTANAAATLAQRYAAAAAGAGVGAHGFGRRGIINEDELDVRTSVGAWR